VKLDRPKFGAWVVGGALLVMVWGLWAWPERTASPVETVGHAEESGLPPGPASVPLPPLAPEPEPTESKAPLPSGLRGTQVERASSTWDEPLDAVEVDLAQEVEYVWPESWPARLQPGEFTRSSDSAFSDCPPDDRYTYLGVDCSEAPCVVMFYVARDENRDPGDWDAVSSIVERCPPWNSDYPTAVERLTRCSLAKSCGSAEGWFLMISPSDAVDFASEEVGMADEQWKEALQARCLSASNRHSCPDRL
jgi:hypothetical protein